MGQTKESKSKGWIEVIRRLKLGRSNVIIFCHLYKSFQTDGVYTKYQWCLRVLIISRFIVTSPTLLMEE